MMAIMEKIKLCLNIYNTITCKRLPLGKVNKQV